MTSKNDIPIYNSNKWKVLLDDQAVTHFGPEQLFTIDDDGITLYPNAKSDALKQFNPKKIKAIYCDEDTTITIKMKIEKFKMQQVRINTTFPVVPIKLYGKPKTKFTD